ncbi:glycosyltransferase [Roseisolibacter agri]|uniref:glycosyltransferase n=1 Tax=Roseisolibacter agri TaxID=2014610 RepID=UPI0024E13744|nr:glycosyltransferase [Roseisolibacter agri]
MTSPADAPSVALVVPCYNEARRLDVAAFARALDASPALRLLFVDDGSTDDTRAVLDAMASAHADRVAVLALPRNGGKAGAVWSGLRHVLAESPATRAAYVGYWDADLSTPLAALPELVAVLRARAACHAVLGSRVRLLGRRIARRLARHYLGRVWATAASVVLGMPVYDTQCGAKLFRVAGPLTAALEAPFLSRWAFDVELLARLHAATAGQDVDESFVEHPLAEWRDVAGSKLTMGAALRSGLDLARIAWRVRRGARRAVSPVVDRPPAPTGPR